MCICYVHTHSTYTYLIHIKHTHKGKIKIIVKQKLLIYFADSGIMISGRMMNGGY